MADIRQLDDSVKFPALPGASTAPGDLFLIFDVSAGVYKAITRAELVEALNAVVEDGNGDAGVTRHLAVGGTVTCHQAFTAIHPFAGFAALQTSGGTGFRWVLSNDGTFSLQKTADGFATASVPMTVNSAGYVGVGIGVNPVVPLQVAGEARFGPNGEFAVGNNGNTFISTSLGHALFYVPTTKGFYFHINGAQILAVDAAAFSPGATDNAMTNGSASHRWSTVYAGTGTINTSDRTEKQDIVDLFEVPGMHAFFLELASSVRLFRFIASVQEKGDAARTHVGWIAQEVIDIAESHGVDALKYGFVGFDLLMVQETFTVLETRPKTERVSVEVVNETIEDDRIVVTRETVEQDVPVMRTLPVFENDVQIGERLVPDTETVEVEYTRDVQGEVRRYNVRMDQLLAGCIAALAAGPAD